MNSHHLWMEIASGGPAKMLMSMFVVADIVSSLFVKLGHFQKTPHGVGLERQNTSKQHFRPHSSNITRMSDACPTWTRMPTFGCPTDVGCPARTSDAKLGCIRGLPKQIVWSDGLFVSDGELSTIASLITIPNYSFFMVVPPLVDRKRRVFPQFSTNWE